MSRCEFRSYQTAPKKAGGAPVTEKIVDPFGRLRNDRDEDDGDDDYALVIRRTYGEKFDLASTTLQVNSPYLLATFRELVGPNYTTVASDFNKPFELESPFQMLFHYWDELDQHRREAEDSYVRLHLNLLFDFLDHDLGKDRSNLTDALSHGQIRYYQAWAIFRPGELLYTQVMGHHWLLRCQKTAYEVSTVAGPYLTVYCTYTDHDGQRHGSAEHKFMIFQKREFGGENPAYITDLPVYPRRFVKGQDGMEAKLTARGETFLSRRSLCVQAYDGIARFLKEPPYTYYDPDPDTYSGVWLPFKEIGRVVLDRATFEEDQYSLRVSIRVTASDAMLCPPYALGYSISRKDWCQFLVDNTSDVQWKQDVWNDLILSNLEKGILEALVTSHQFPDNARDQPEQKGKGLVILLHGTPGSGKTLTAEVAAESSKKALISASLGELNRDNSPWRFEYNLRRVLQYATMWKAVVLLDEADVFLESREDSSSTPDRNALVAVFLKELEYFSGIVFLTTNRLGSLDQAMKSRIHLALGYAPPGIETRRQIWTQVLERIPKEELGIEDIDDEIVSLLQRKLNGREIANATTTARTLARFQKRKLELEHIENVLRVREEFDRSLEKERLVRKAVSVKMGGTVGTGLIRQNSILTAEPEDVLS